MRPLIYLLCQYILYMYFSCFLHITQTVCNKKETELTIIVNHHRQDLRHGNKIKMSRKQVLMKTGELFSLR